jgi:predicted ester cyclase
MVPEYKFHLTTQPSPIEGPEGYRQFLAGFVAAFPDVHFSFADTIIEGNKVVVRWTLQGTHKGKYVDIAPTGKQITMTGININHFNSEGLMVEGWQYGDELGFLQQLGVIPMPEHALV